MQRKPFALLLIFVLVMVFMTGCGGNVATLGMDLTLQVEPTTFRAAGETLTYTYTITNIGNRFLNGLFVQANSETATCPSTSLEPGASMECSSVHTVTDAEVEAGGFTISALAQGSGESNSCCGGGCGSQTENSMAFATFDVKRDLSLNVTLTKTSDPATFTQAGQEITYTYTIENTGAVDITDAISIEDDRVEVTCPDAENELPVGATLTCSAVYTVTEEDIQSGAITNTAYMVAGDQQSAPVSLTVMVEAMPALTLTKTASPNFYTFAGEPITYTFVVTNTGNVPLTEVMVVDPSLSSVECPELTNGVLAPGESITCTGKFTVASQNVGLTITNIAAASAKYGDVTIPSASVSALVYFNSPVTEAPLPPDSSFCYQITDLDYCLSLYPVCTTDTYITYCKPGP